LLISVEDAGEGPSVMSVETIPKILLVAAAVLVTILFTSYMTVSAIDTKEIEMDMFLNRLLYSPDGISYTDSDTGRTYLGIIDPSKIDKDKLEKAISFSSDRYISAKISLYYKGSLVKEAKYQEDWFDKLSPIAKSGIGGKGGVDYSKEGFILEYYDTSGFKEGVLTIEIVRPRT